MNKITKKFLEDEYLNKHKTMRLIAKEYGISVATVHKYIHKFGITTRPAHLGMTGHSHTENAKRKISQKHSGKAMSAETRLKISNARKGLITNPSKYGGHTKKHCRGYIMVYVPNHPYATKDGYVFEHILAFEKANNCYVDRNNYVIHHINGIKTDNRIENLALMTKHEHMSLHMKQRYNDGRKQNAQ